MKISLRSTRRGVAREGGPVYIEVRLDPGPRDAGPSTERKPVALCPVFDRSGSMGGPAGGWDRDMPPFGSNLPLTFGRTKMDGVKAAAHELVDNIRDGDYVALVSFSGTGRVEVPMTLVNVWSRELLHRAISGFRPEDSTNLYEGMVLGEQQFGPGLPATHNCKVVLLSDGLANVGITSPGGMADFALSAHRRGITVSTIGVGLDYGAEIMGTLAQCGGGRFYHIADTCRLTEIVLGELHSAASTMARRVTLEMSAGPLAAIGENLNLFRQEAGPDGSVVYAGDLVGSRNIVFELAPTAGFTGESLPVRVVCRWDDENKKARRATATLSLPVVSSGELETLPVDADLMAEVARLLEAQATRLASGAYDAGDHARARASVSSGLTGLARMAAGIPGGEEVVWEAQERLENLAGRLDRHEVMVEEAKMMYCQAFDSMVGPQPSPGGRPAGDPAPGRRSPRGTKPGTWKRKRETSSGGAP